MKPGSNTSSFLSQYFALSYLLLLINASVFLGQINYINFTTYFFAGVVYFTYCFLYLLPFAIVLGLLRKILNYKRSPVFLKSPYFLGSLAVIALTALQLLIYMDSFIFRMFGFHFNSFVWNLIFTKGGVESMGSSQSTVRSFIVIVLVFFVAQAAILLLLMMVPKVKNFCANFLTRRKLAIALITLLAMAGLQSLVYGFGSFYNYRPILTVSRAFPFYMPVTFRRFAKSLGLKQPQESSFAIKFREINLKYPLNPINQQADHNNYNIVILMAESLRADMLDPQIMPKTWAFSQKAVRFNQHYSGGNGTRMAIFSAFYGLYGNYWFKFLEEHRGPVLMDLLIDNNYQIDVFSSAKFSYPEFDKTVFARLPQNQLHDSRELESGMLEWKLDRQNVGLMLDFFKNRDKSRSFMTFMFFESPHAPYHFPPENEIRTPWLEEFNYATVDLKKDISLIKNRYINSCNHLDSQFERILKYLEENSLLDSTIVILTGDHGEEFMEHGRWGHNSNYSDVQTLVPMVLWAPGVKPHRVDSITSHLDIPATICKLLGVTNPPQDYSEGIDLLGTEKHQFTVISDWDTIAYVDNEHKAIFPTTILGLNTVTTKTNVEITDRTTFYKAHQPDLVRVMKDLSRFSK
ncbi:MAG: sulfatase-like hydrolase/transferase [Phycisphaerae bacterium]|nr:sulfatase-like hydrolase/transferase [Phycisphaerae bacterium]